MVVTYAQVAVAIPLLFLITPQTPQYAISSGIVFGFAMGADYMLIPLMAADVFGLQTLGRAMSAIVPGDTITHALVAQPDRRDCAACGAATAARCGSRAGSRQSAQLRSRSCQPSRRPLGHTTAATPPTTPPCRSSAGAGSRRRSIPTTL